MINDVDEDGWTPLYRAISYNNEPVVCWLEANGGTIRPGGAGADVGAGGEEEVVSNPIVPTHQGD